MEDDGWWRWWWSVARSGRLRHEAQHWSPPTPETNEDGKRENNRFRDRERNSQTGTEYIPTRLDNSNADLGTERMEPVPKRIAEQAGRERERERKREREVRRAEGRRSRDHRCRKRKAENGRELAE